MNPFVTGLLVMALTLLLAHFFPWPARLHRLAAYGIGVAAILLGVWIWLGADPVWRGLVIYAVVAGLTTGLGYALDGLLRLWQQRRIGSINDDRNA